MKIIKINTTKKPSNINEIRDVIITKYSQNAKIHLKRFNDSRRYDDIY